MFYVLLYVTLFHSSIAIILMGKRELVALLNLSSWCLVIVEWLFIAVPWGCLWFVIVVFPDHTHLLFFKMLEFYLLAKYNKLGPSIPASIDLLGCRWHLDGISVLQLASGPPSVLCQSN